jgi:hypothetical protein
MKTFKSRFNSFIKVVYIDRTDAEYDRVKHLFDIHGYAFLTQSVIFVNKSKLEDENLFKKSYLIFIESHEVAHYVLGHDSLKRNSKHEAEADYIGIKLCEDANFTSALNVGKKYFAQRNSISFEKYHTKYGLKLVSKLVNKK